jgi:hypothetical protein
LGIAIENTLADQVHERDHQLEWERGHVHIAVFFHTLAAGPHDTPYAVLAVVLCLRMDRQRHADLLSCGINRIEHAMSQVDTVNVGRQHGAHDRAVPREIFQLLYGCERILHRNQSDAFKPFRIRREVLLNQPAIDGMTNRRGERLVSHAVD